MDTEFDSTPLPPSVLRARVTGVADGDLFLGLGRRIAEDVMTVFSETEKPSISPVCPSSTLGVDVAG